MLFDQMERYRVIIAAHFRVTVAIIFVTNDFPGQSDYILLKHVRRIEIYLRVPVGLGTLVQLNSITDQDNQVPDSKTFSDVQLSMRFDTWLTRAN